MSSGSSAGAAQAYRHTQFGGFTVVILGAGIAGIVFLNETAARGPVTLVVEVVLLACLALFYCLRVEVDARQVSLRFGVGLIRRRFAIGGIVSARQVRNRWYYGWGIRWTPHGWLFNAAGLDAVEIRMSNEKSYRIATDEPEELLRAIQQGTRLRV